MSTATKPVVLAQLGCGYWGPNLLRNFSTRRGARVKYVVEESAERLAYVKTHFPAVQQADLDQALADPEVNAVVVATPAGSHYSLARRCLEAGKHAFVEKPLAMTVQEVDSLEALSRPRKLTLMAGHTFLFNNAVRHVKKMIDGGELGEVRYIYSQRLNLGRIRSDIDALWNFAPHDVSIIQYWLNDAAPQKVVRSGMAYVQKGIDDVVFMTMTYPTGVLANIHVSWLDPQKVRKMVVVGSKRMVLYDDVSEDKIVIHDKGIDRRAVIGENMDYDRAGAGPFDYRSGDVLIPKVQMKEPLAEEAEHFLECIRTGAEPITGPRHAREVVRILQDVQRV